MTEQVKQNTADIVAELLKETSAPAEAVIAYIELFSPDEADVEDFEERYIGHYESRKDFAIEMFEATGGDDKLSQWPYNCIDWEHAGDELMYDYWEDNGYYFHNY